MSVHLFIPWFQAIPWHIPLPWSVTIPWVGITIEDIPVQPFGLLVAGGVIFGAKMAEVFAERHGMRARIAADLALHVVGWGFLFAYFLNPAMYEPYKLIAIWEDPRNLFRTYLGLSSYGGFFGAVVGIVVWHFRRRLPVFAVSDSIAFGFPFGWLLGRTGCFVVHDHPGRVTDFPLAVDQYVVPGNPPYLPRHDLGLYEVFWSLAVIAIFLVLERKERVRGFYVALLPMLYAPVRFFLDFLRATEEEGGDVRWLFGLTPGQYASLATFITSLIVMRIIHARPQPVVTGWGAISQTSPEEQPEEEEQEASAPHEEESPER